MAIAQVLITHSKRSDVGFESRTREDSEWRNWSELLPNAPGQFLFRFQIEERRTVVTTTETVVVEERGHTTAEAPSTTATADLEGGGIVVDVDYRRTSEAGIYAKVTTTTKTSVRYGGWMFYARVTPHVIGGLI